MAEAHKYQQIGNIFRAAREAMSVDIDQASHSLFIRARYLKALESGNFHELPGPAYVKGYMLAYAQFLLLDEQQILRQFHEIEADFKRSLYFPAILNSEKSASPKMVSAGLVLALLAIGVWLYPEGQNSSSVENIDAWRQQLLKKGHVSAFSSRNDTCFQAKDLLYPPCYAREQRFDLLPLKRRVSSVMDLKM